LAAGVNTSGNFGSAGTLTVAGALTIGTGTNLDIDLNSATTVGGNVNDLIQMTGTGTSGLLTIGGATTVNINALGTITAGSTSSNYYTLISGATSTSGLLASNFSIGTLVGTTDSAHFFISGNNLDVYFSGGTAIQSFTSPSPSPLRIIAGATTTVSASLQNTATAGNNALNVSLADSSTGSTGSVTSFSGGNAVSVTAGSSSTVTGTFTAGSAGTGTWGITNTDANASPTTASTSNGVTVYSKSTPSLSTGTATFGVVHQGATVATQTTNLQNAAGTYVAGAQITSLGGLTNIGGQSVIAQGTSDSLGASVSTATAGAYSQSYTVGTSDDQSIVGWSANSGLTFTVSGQVYSGQGVWNTNGSGSWGAVAATPLNWTANGGTPGLDSGFTTTDSATFGSVLTTGTANVTLDGDSPSLNAITFNDSAASYNIGQGTGGTVHLNNGAGTATITDTAGNNTISAPVEFDSNASTSVASGTNLTLSGVISDSGTRSLTITGPGTTVLTAANTYTGGTIINSGKLLIKNTTGSGTGTGAVTVNSTGTLAGNGIISGAGVTINGGGTLSSGARSQISGTGLSTLGGMSLAGTTQLTVGSSVGTANLTFDLGSGTSGINGGSASFHSFSNPNNNTTYLSLNASSSINFAGSTSISLVDLTNTNGSNGSLGLFVGTPYLLVHAALNTDYFNLVINSGTNANPILSLSQNDSNSVNGYVLGVWAGGSNPLTDYTAISISQYGADGVTPLTGVAGGNYPAPTLYLDAGNLEVVPEPGTWALMIGGLALLVVIQRRRNKLG
jgi:fibronectin-binding autotransporter adhesin